MNKIRHLALLLPSLSSGGAERTILKLALGLKDRGYQVDLVVVHRDGPLEKEIPSDLHVVDLKAPRSFTSRALSSLPALIHYIKVEKPDLLFTGLMTNLIAVWAKLLARASTLVVISERNILSLEVKQFPRDIRFRMMPAMVKLSYPHADGIVAVSQAVADDLRAMTCLPKDRIRVIHNPVINDRLKAKAHIPVDHPWFALGEPPVILAVSRLVPQKDYPTMLKAFSQVRQTTPARLLILGEGQERQNLERLISELGLDGDVQLLGFVDNPYPYMKKAAVIVLSSEFEGSPGVLIEALYCGAAVVATDCPGGSAEILANGAYGKLVPVGDYHAMAAAIQSYLTNGSYPPRRESWQLYEQEHVLDQYTDYFSQVCLKKNGLGQPPGD